MTSIVSIIETLKKLTLGEKEPTQTEQKQIEEKQNESISESSDDYFWDMEEDMSVNYYKT